MAKVVIRSLRPGETIFGGGKGVISLNFRNSQEKPSTFETVGLDSPPQPFDVSMRIAERQMEQERLDATASGPNEEPSIETAVEEVHLALDRKILAESAEPSGKERQ